MQAADLFILLDNVEFSKGSYGNRVKIKSRSRGGIWLTVPVLYSKGSHRTYNEVEIAAQQNWQDRHANLLRDAYRNAPYFNPYFSDLMDIISTPYPHLSALNIAILHYLRAQLGVHTPMVVSSDIKQDFGMRSERIMHLCQHFGADIYLSGTGARKYNDETAFARQGIRIVYQQFTSPVYPQLHGDFIPNLSVIDLLFNCGPESAQILMEA
jgi:hypothetical protein